MIACGHGGASEVVVMFCFLIWVLFTQFVKIPQLYTLYLCIFLHVCCSSQNHFTVDIHILTD